MMKRIIFAGVILGLSQLDAKDPLEPMPPVPMPNEMDVAFSSEGTDIVQRFIGYIAQAEKEVLISAYAITDERVIAEIVRLHRRGITVAVLLDPKPAFRDYNTPERLRGNGVPVILAKRGQYGDGWHNQHYAVIDREAVINVTADLTPKASRNNESLWAVQLPSIAIRYYNVWLYEASVGTLLK